MFRGGFTLDAAEAVGAGIGGDREVFDLVASLADKSLLRREEREDVPRYRMLETVREYGLEQLAASSELEAARREHAAHFLALAERAAPAWWGPAPGAWLDRLEAERDNLREALAWAHEEHATEFACRLASALHWFWRSRGPVGEGRRWTEALLAGAEEVAPALRAALLMGAGDLAMTQGEFARAAELLEASIALARELGDWPTLAHALFFRGATAVYEGQFDLGEEFVDQAVDVARAMGAPFWHALGLTILAAIARGRGEHARAAALLAESNAVCQAERIAWPTALNLSLMGEIATDLGELDRAEALGREGLRRAWAIGERRYFAGALAGLARAVAARGDPEWGARLYGAVDAVLEATGANLPVTALPSFEPARAAVRAALGEARFAAAWAAGHALPLSEVLAEAERGATSAAQPADGERALGALRHRSASRRGNWRCCGWWRPDAPTARSPRRCSSPSAPPPRTSPTSSPNSASNRGSRPPPGPSATASPESSTRSGATGSLLHSYVLPHPHVRTLRTSHRARPWMKSVSLTMRGGRRRRIVGTDPSLIALAKGGHMSASDARSVAELVVEFLIARKVDRVFGLQGGHIQPIWDQLASAACASSTCAMRARRCTWPMLTRRSPGSSASSWSPPVRA